MATPGVFWEQFFCGVIIALGYQLYSWWRERHRAEEELCSDYARYQYSQQGLEKDEIRRYTAKNSNNHNHCKFKHGTQWGAQAEVDRMRSLGYEDSERLNVYYNENLKGWFVGRGWKRVWYSSVGIVFFCPRANNLPGFFLLVIGFGGSHEQIRGQKKQATGNSPGQKKTF